MINRSGSPSNRPLGNAITSVMLKGMIAASAIVPVVNSHGDETDSST